MARLDGFPTSWGSNRASVVTVVGPASYSQYSAPTTGGQVVDANAATGVKVVDFAIGGHSDAGTHRVEVVHREPSPVAGLQLANTRLRLKWVVIASGAEAAGAADLSGQTARLLVIGPK